jgi:hypothetical protein
MFFLEYNPRTTSDGPCEVTTDRDRNQWPTDIKNWTTTKFGMKTAGESKFLFFQNKRGWMKTLRQTAPRWFGQQDRKKRMGLLEAIYKLLWAEPDTPQLGVLATHRSRDVGLDPKKVIAAVIDYKEKLWVVLVLCGRKSSTHGIS